MDGGLPEVFKVDPQPLAADGLVMTTANISKNWIILLKFLLLTLTEIVRIVPWGICRRDDDWIMCELYLPPPPPQPNHFLTLREALVKWFKFWEGPC